MTYYYDFHSDDDGCSFNNIRGNCSNVAVGVTREGNDGALAKLESNLKAIKE
jgi:hypothetical protein